jgi:hypothetical protein
MFTSCFARYCSRASACQAEGSAKAGEARRHVAQRRGYNGRIVNNALQKS